MEPVFTLIFLEDHWDQKNAGLVSIVRLSHQILQLLRLFVKAPMHVVRVGYKECHVQTETMVLKYQLLIRVYLNLLSVLLALIAKLQQRLHCVQRGIIVQLEL